MAHLDDAPPKDPRVAACLGFVLAALAGALATVTWMYWRQTAWILESVPRRARSGGMAFSLNLPGFALEIAAHAFGFLGLVTLGAVWCWKSATLRTWYSVGGVLCLLPELALFAARCGLLRW